MKYECIFLDRDGTLNPDPGYISSIDKFSFFNFTIPALKKLSEEGFQFCIITNQSGIGRGLISYNNFKEINNFIVKEFKKYSINLLDIIFCPDHPNHATNRRKPGPGMFLEAKEKYKLNLINCLMIGDSVIDMTAARFLGMDMMLVMTGKGNGALDELGHYHKLTYVVENLKKGAEILCH